MAKLNANQIALVIFMGWYISEDTFLNAAHRKKLGRIMDDILQDELGLDFDDIGWVHRAYLPGEHQQSFPSIDFDGEGPNTGKTMEEPWDRLVNNRIKDGNLPDDLERLMIRLTTMDLKLITEEIILLTVKVWNYGN